MSDFGVEYNNGADGSCHECGEPTEEEWHRLCPDCYRAEQGWPRRDRAALDQQHENRQRLSTLALAERVAALERQVAELGELTANLARRRAET